MKLEQGWPEEVRQRYHYTSQGTLILPAAWLMEIRQGFFSSKKLIDPETLAGLRFLTDGIEAGAWNKAGLPIGWTVDSWAKPGGPADSKMPKAGFNCAACHTGQINYKGTAILIEGGGALHDAAQFQNLLGTAVLGTYLVPWKHAAFVDAVAKATGQDKAAVEDGLKAAFWKAASAAWTGFRMSLYPGEGYGRLDALQRIANTLLADDLHMPSNNRPAGAPVKFPFVWDIWRFDWVQYNGSVRQPMARNAGEALGVRAETNFVDADGKPVAEPARWDSSVNVVNLEWLEHALERLRAPAWPAEVLGPIDAAKTARGKVVFAERCAGCHGIRVDRTRVPAEWVLPMIPLTEIGTAPQQALNFKNETYDGGPLNGGKPIDGKGALKLVTTQVSQRAYDVLGYNSQQRAAADGFGRDNVVRAPEAYKARPLVGAWAVPPYLHNGSVPSLWDLLSPVRPGTFYVGTREYDPVKVGLRTEAFAGGQVFDTAKAGNENTGHWFADDQRAGRLGSALAEADRWAVIEYLKGAGYADYPCTDNTTKEALTGAVCGW